MERTTVDGSSLVLCHACDAAWMDWAVLRQRKGQVHRPGEVQSDGARAAQEPPSLVVGAKKAVISPVYALLNLHHRIVLSRSRNSCCPALLPLADRSERLIQASVTCFTVLGTPNTPNQTPLRSFFLSLSPSRSFLPGPKQIIIFAKSKARHRTREARAQWARPGSIGRTASWGPGPIRDWQCASPATSKNKEPAPVPSTHLAIKAKMPVAHPGEGLSQA